MAAPLLIVNGVDERASGILLWRSTRSAVFYALMTCVLLFSPFSNGQSASVEVELNALTSERETLTNELAQYQKTLAILGVDQSNPEQSSNPAVRNLVTEMTRIKSKIISITEREVTLLQEQITAANAVSAETEAQNRAAAESRPLRTHTRDYSVVREAENVARLLSLIANHYTELQESMRTLPSAEELALRDAAQQDAATLALIPFSADKVRLNGSEGSTALAQVTQRLNDNNFPESRRDIALICSIRTRLYGALIASENRSLIPVGKNHYVAKVRLQPGDSTLRVGSDRWEVRLPENISAQDYLITFYNPPWGKSEFHIFSIEGLLAEDKPHIPAWLPAGIQLKPRVG